ncbi:methylated-DNA--[protein]-cysteine S-methyltransferase [Temperatibacter marinus]|uniref:Methylated-DNA--protein-cysteine methyltransferase n=1 Tax=Temperatibacter marinus TaxID=1456591 RepID=A0AA52EE45_9PROT|nr:methylated-DNA--[protein]-cysteine S-methyltransferase [Temperatibacter marinus]WND03045.1 methylated-DNA--[protein]-cysteine S-methyltransferase [Temperatibacter marinus]
MADLRKSQFQTPIGCLTLLHSKEGLCLAEFTDRVERISRFIGTQSVKDDHPPQEVKHALTDYFNGRLSALEAIEIFPIGTDYQRKVWTYLQTIPLGTTQSYGEMATAINSSARAVGTANGRNNLALFIPCHRVIGKDGRLTGYAGGLDRKHWLLRHEEALEGTHEFPF